MIIASLKSLEGVEVDEASSGLEAVERLALAPVNMLFLDLNMPDIHGIEVIEFVRSHKSPRKAEATERARHLLSCFHC